MNGIVDFHSHILPGIDDGSKNPEESMAMLEAEQAQGIDRVVATPHFYPQHDQLSGFLQRRDRAAELLKERIRGKALPRLHIGAEVHFFQGISDCDALPLLTVDGGQYILIEMPHGAWTEEMYRQLEQIYIKHNLYPIIAHIDRYLGGFRSARRLQRLEEMPVLIQANAEFFLERRTEKTAMGMLQAGRIHLLGSDCHNLTSRKPNLEEALKKIRLRLGEEAVESIRRCEQRVLGN